MASYFIYILARTVIFVMSLLPRTLGVCIVRLLAVFAYYVDWRHRHIAHVNLTIAFPALSKRERSRIARKSFQNTALNLLEVSKLPKLTADNISSLVTYDPNFGLENYKAAAAKGKGILYLTGHFSSWELLPAAHALYGHPLSFVTRPLDNLYFEKYLLGVRESKGNRVLNKKNAARQILKSLNAKETAGILMDQNTHLQEGLFADFFGVPAATTSGMALLAIHTQASVLPGYLTPMKDGKYRIKFLQPIEVERTSDVDQDIQRCTRRFNEVLEQIIREQPESWLWGHKRWKQQPACNPQDLYSLSAKELADFLDHVKRQTAIGLDGSK